jgi:hypothetical protein
LILLSPAGFYVGWRYAGRMTSHWWIVIALTCLGIITAFAIFRFYPAWEYHLIPSFLGDFVDIVRWAPFVTLFFGIAARKATSKFLPIELTILALLFFIYAIMRVNWIYQGNDVDPKKFEISDEGVCIQSTGYTCAPAGAVTLLKHFGIAATEKELADLSHTGFSGTEIVPLARAIALKTREKGLKTDIITTDWDGLKQLPTPFIVNVKWAPMIDHVMVVFSISGTKISIANPLSGVVSEWNKKQFLNDWRGSAIIIK